MAIRLTWTETFEVDVETARLVSLFEEHIPGVVADLLGTYLEDNGPSDSDTWPILEAIRVEAAGRGETVTTDINDVDADEI